MTQSPRMVNFTELSGRLKCTFTAFQIGWITSESRIFIPFFSIIYSLFISYSFLFSLLFNLIFYWFNFQSISLNLKDFFVKFYTVFFLSLAAWNIKKHLIFNQMLKNEVFSQSGKNPELNRVFPGMKIRRTIWRKEQSSRKTQLLRGIVLKFLTVKHWIDAHEWLELAASTFLLFMKLVSINLPVFFTWKIGFFFA